MSDRNLAPRSTSDSATSVRSRRRWIWPGLIAALGVIAVITGLALSPMAAFARGGGFFGTRHGHDPEAMRERVDFAAEWVLDKIEADEAQTAEVKAILGDVVTQLAALGGDREAMHAAVVAELTAPTVDRAALEQIRLDQLSRFESASQILTRAIGDVAEVLTPEQRVELAELADRFRGERGRRHRWHH